MRGPILGALIVGMLSACSLVQSLDEYTNGGGNQDPDGNKRAENVPKCAGSDGHCVPPPPNTWKGPFALYEGAAEGAPECTKVMDDAFAELNAPPATCGCSCSNVNGFTCATSVITSKNGSCGPCGAETNLTPGACTPLPKCTDGTDFSHVMLRTSHVSGTGSCSPSSTGRAAPPVAWGRIARACEIAPRDGATAECSGSRCVSAPTSPFFGTACIAYEGDVACPGESYSLKKTFHRDVDDGRDCKCTCGTASVTCGNSFLFAPKIFAVNDSSCTNADKNMKGMSWNACTAAPASSFGYAAYGTLEVSGGGTCPPTDTPSGTATPSKPVTICCM